MIGKFIIYLILVSILTLALVQLFTKNWSVLSRNRQQHGGAVDASSEAPTAESTEGAALSQQQIQDILSIQHEQHCTKIVDKVIAANIPINLIQQYLTQLNPTGLDVDALMEKIHCCVKNRLLQQMEQLNPAYEATLQQYQQTCTTTDYPDALSTGIYFIKSGNYHLTATVANPRPQLVPFEPTSTAKWKIEHLFDDVYHISNNVEANESNTESTAEMVPLYLEYNDTKDTFPTMKEKQESFDVNKITDSIDSMYPYLWRITPQSQSHHYTIHSYVFNTCLAKDSRNPTDVLMKLNNQAGASTCGCRTTDDMSEYLFTII